MTNGTTTWNYTYNADGLRTSKSNGTVTYDYTYAGDKLTYMTDGTNELYISYDASGIPMSLDYNGTTYYYVTNVQGDVIALVDSAGTEKVSYSYDAWGNLLSTGGDLTNTLGKDNPLRYRGYVYDEGFNPNYLNVNANDLSVMYQIRFNDSAMYDTFKEQMGHDSRWSFYDHLGLAVLQF